MSCRVRNTYSLLASTSCSKQFLKGCVRHETDYRARPLKMSFLQVVLESVATVSLHALVDMTMHGQLNIYWKKSRGMWISLKNYQSHFFFEFVATKIYASEHTVWDLLGQFHLHKKLWPANCNSYFVYHLNQIHHRFPLRPEQYWRPTQRQKSALNWKKTGMYQECSITNFTIINDPTSTAVQ